jgi:hypothetical protein
VRKTEALGSSAKQVAPAALSEARQREQQSKATTVDQDILQRVDGMARMREGEIQEAVAANESAQAGAASADSLRAVSASFSSDRCDEIATATPEAWLQCITSLEDAGLTDAAAEQRKLLAAAFPDFNIP